MLQSQKTDVPSAYLICNHEVSLDWDVCVVPFNKPSVCELFCTFFFPGDIRLRRR